MLLPFLSAESNCNQNQDKSSHPKGNFSCKTRHIKCKTTANNRQKVAYFSVVNIVFFPLNVSYLQLTMDFMKTRPIIDWHAIFILKNMTITWMFQFCVSLKEIPNRKCEQFQEMMDYFFNSWQPTLHWISSYPILFSDSLHFVRHFFLFRSSIWLPISCSRWWNSCSIFVDFSFFEFFISASLRVFHLLLSGDFLFDTFVAVADDEKTQTKWKKRKTQVLPESKRCTIFGIWPRCTIEVKTRANMNETLWKKKYFEVSVNFFPFIAYWNVFECIKTTANHLPERDCDYG